MWKFEEIAGDISNGKLIQVSAFESIDINDALDQRDSSELEDDFISAADDLNASWESFDNAGDLESEINLICERAFKKCFEYTKSSDLSAYVNDDFEVLAKAAAMKFESPYLKNMMAVYSRGEFHH